MVRLSESDAGARGGRETYIVGDLLESIQSNRLRVEVRYGMA